tara:strand:+ start:4982 stop:5251 length:270 start_codon:yes stop_codon:yes gene_type:complete
MVIANHFGRITIEKGLKRGFDLKTQIHSYKKFMDTIYKRKFNCYKLRATDLDLYFYSFFALIKLKQIINPYNDVIILKIKGKRVVPPTF